MRHAYWVGGKSKANTSSLWGRRGDRLYCSINSYNMGEGRTIKVWFFSSCIPRPSLVLSALLSLGHHSYETFYLRLSLEPTWPGLEPSQNPARDSAKTHGLPTEITDLVSRPNEPQILDLSSHKLFSERQWYDHFLDFFNHKLDKKLNIVKSFSLHLSRWSHDFYSSTC